ncbi:uncharacterized protein LOC117287918 isoform X2 [Asterias rubens]|uniref:uncharacterized protein LOC117287918 isoform X2 n=1 Tax=Asterias rubens TaxID=7604 RepID=UPI0014555C0F|nr:uncharacterized protein LOC117287918 isoform X2 [Asterias rubens]
MYSYVGWKGLWVLSVILLLGCCVTVQGQGSSSSSSSSGVISDLPCASPEGDIVQHGERYQMSECSFCECDNSTLSCQFETCPPLTCRNRIKFEGVCCKACPYNVTIEDVVPIVPPDTQIEQGKVSEIALDLDAMYAFNAEATSVAGQGLWTTRLWMAENEDGTGELSGTVMEEALTEGQQSQGLKRNPGGVFSIEDIRYRFDLTDHTCEEANFICAKFNKGPNPEVQKDYLTFHFTAKPTKDVLTGCVENAFCKTSSGVISDLPCASPEGDIVQHGERYQMSECSFCECDNSTLSCQFETCPPLTCRNRIKFEGVCCKACPYNVTIEDVVPIVPPDTQIEQGKVSEISLDLDAMYAFNAEATSVAGQGLWTTRLWMAENEDGTGELSGTVMEEALTEGQQSQGLKRNPGGVFSIEDIRYRFDLTDHTCEEANFICAKFNKGPNPEVQKDYLTFHFTAKPTKDVLTGCVENAFCKTSSGVISDLPCASPEGDIVQHGERYQMSECSFCECDNSTLSCQFETCPPLTCRNRIKFEGVCCKACPYNVTAEDVVPVVPPGTEIDQGRESEITLDLIMMYSYNSEATSVAGQGLWTTRLWMAENEDGTGELSGTVMEEALTEGQQSQGLKRNPGGVFSIEDIRYRFDLTDHTCEEANFICAKFNKGPNPEVQKDYLTFHFTAKPTKDVLTGCVENAFCKTSSGVISDLPCASPEGDIVQHGERYQMSECSFCECDNSTLSCQFETCPPLTCRNRIKFEGVCCKACPYNVTIEDVVPIVPPDTQIEQGKVSEIALDLDAMYAFNAEATSVAGQGLWTTRLWMAENEDGTGELSGTVMEEALTEGQQSQGLKRNPGGVFSIEDIRYRFDLTDHTCEEANFICAKFNKGPNPEVQKDYLTFHFTAKPTKDVLTGCVENAFCKTSSGVISDLPCASPEGDIVQHGERYQMSECSFCECDNSTLSCQFETCPPLTCRNRIKFEGVCCKACPYNVTIEDVVPIVPPDTQIEQGKVSEIALDLDAMYAFNAEATSVAGQGLWTTRLWMAENEDGTGELSGTVMEEALTEGQQSQGLKRNPGGVFSIEDIRYRFDLTDHTCEEANFICAKFNKGPNPEVQKDYLTFHFTAKPTKDVLTGCVENAFCKTSSGVISDLPCASPEGDIVQHGERYQMSECSFCECDNSTLSCQFETCPPLTCRNRIKFEGVCCKACPYNVTIEDVVPIVPPDTQIEQGKVSEIALDLDAMYAFNAEATSVAGQGLWTTRLWMAENEDGTGELSGTVMEEALTEGQQSQGLKRNPGGVFSIEDIRYRFDLTGHTCEEANFICAKFNKGPHPEVENDYLTFHFTAKPTKDVLTGCVENTFCKSVTVTYLDWERGVGKMKYGVPTILTIDATVGTAAESSELEGSGLWKMNIFGSENMDGSGKRKPLKSQILSADDQSKPLISPGSRMHFIGISTSFPIEDVGCGELSYLCLEFESGQNPSYAFGTSTGEDSLISCKAEECKVILRGDNLWCVGRPYGRDLVV